MKRLTTARNVGLTGLALLLSIPIAAAAKLPLVGEWTWMSWQGLIMAAAIFAGLAVFLGVARAAYRRTPILGSAKPGAAAILLLLVASAVNAGGLVNSSFFSGSAAPGTAAAVGTGGDFDAGLYESTSDVTFYAADLATKSSVNPTVYIYQAGAETDKAIVEGSAVAEYSATLSSGSVTISGIQTQTLGCTVDVLLDLANYYEKIVRDVEICVAKNPLGNNDVAVPTFYLMKYGTHSLSKMDTTLTCTDDTQCDFTVTLRNSVADTYLLRPALKFSTGESAGTLDAVASGSSCEIVEVSSTQYIVFTGDLQEIGSLGLISCQVKITDNGVTGGTFNITADDHWQAYDASAWNTNSNVRGASATAATEVTFA